MQSKIKSIQGAGTYENANGVDLGNGKVGFFTFEYEFEEGVTLKANHKGQSPFKVGDEVEYEIKRSHETYGNSGTVKKPDTGGGYSGGNKGGNNDKNQESIVLQVCAKIASAQFVEHSQHFGTPADINDYAKELATLLLQSTKELKGE